MYCPKCGKKIADDSIYCMECGAKIEKEPIVVYSADEEYFNPVQEKKKVDALLEEEQTNKELVPPSLGQNQEDSPAHDAIYQSETDPLAPDDENAVTQPLEIPKGETPVGYDYRRPNGKKKDNKLMVIIVAVVVGTLIIALAAFFLLRGKGEKGTEDMTTTMSEETTSTQTTTTAAKTTTTTKKITTAATQDARAQIVKNSNGAFNYDGYIFPLSSEAYLKQSDIDDLLSKVGNNKIDEYLAFAKNEIYARHGQQFNNSKYRDHYTVYDWYNNLDKKSVTQDMFNDYEKENMKTIEEWEKKY